MLFINKPMFFLDCFCQRKVFFPQLQLKQHWLNISRPQVTTSPQQVGGTPAWLQTQDMILNTLAICCFHLQRVTEIFDSGGLILFEDEAHEASRSLKLHLLAFATLADHFYKKRIMLFKLRCKSHYLWHVCDEIRLYRINQNLFHNFAEEDYLGKLKSIAIKCHGRSLTRRVYERYFLLLALVLEEHAKRGN